MGLAYPGGQAAGASPLALYLLLVNLVTFLVAAARHRAATGASRVPESVLLGLCLAGGSVGGMLGMRLARHKTRKWYFSRGLPAICALQLALLAFAHQAGAV
ncbi:MAG: DUF1294 domain-containing protein [Olsenella sp.]